jgi:uncharacterized membrane protein YgdD (TMEM256/DUF423 family)
LVAGRDHRADIKKLDLCRSNDAAPDPWGYEIRTLFAFWGGLFSFLGVAAGAFGAHALKQRLGPEMLAVFETGARYQIYHALALLAVAWAFDRWHEPGLIVAGWFFIAGILLFSGSLYALTLSGITSLGAITPIGGVAFLLGWVFFCWAALK